MRRADLLCIARLTVVISREDSVSPLRVRRLVRVGGTLSREVVDIEPRHLARPCGPILFAVEDLRPLPLAHIR